MKIVIDARMLGPRWTGIGLYSRKLLEQLQRLDKTNQYLVLVDREQFQDWQPSASNFTKVLVPYKVYGLAEQLILPFKLMRLRPNLVHFLHFNAPAFYFGRRVVTIHDTTLIDYSVAGGGTLGKFKYNLKRTVMLVVMRRATQASRILVPTKSTAEGLIKHYGQKLAPRIVITPEAVDAPNHVPPLSLTPPRLLYVGNLYPYKNIGTLLQAMPDVINIHPDVKLTIVGSTPRFIDDLRTQAIDARIDEHIDFAGFVANKDMAKYYAGASLFVYPSLSEGFGLPPLEAMAAGVPVLAANASAMPEVLGTAARYFDALKAASLAAEIIKLLATPTELETLRARGLEHIKSFSWQRMASQTLEVYNKI